MNHPTPTAGGAWRTIREAIGVLVASPLGCIALGVAFLGVGGVLRESRTMDHAEAERAAWARLSPQDLRDSVRDESALRSVKVRPSTRRPVSDAARAKALRAQVSEELAKALAAAERR